MINLNGQKIVRKTEETPFPYCRRSRYCFVVSVSAVCDQVDQGDQVVPAHQVDDIDEVHELDPVHQVDHKDECCDDIGRFSVDIGRSSVDIG